MAMRETSSFWIWADKTEWGGHERGDDISDKLLLNVCFLLSGAKIRILP